MRQGSTLCSAWIRANNADAKEDFYNTIQRVLDRPPNRNVVILMLGDFDSDNAGRDEVLVGTDWAARMEMVNFFEKYAHFIPMSSVDLSYCTNA